MKLYCYEYHISAAGIGRFSSYEIEVHETDVCYMACDGRKRFPGHEYTLKKTYLEQVLPYGFRPNEYYLVSENPKKDRIFQANVLCRLQQRLCELDKEREAIKNSMPIGEY